MWKKATGTVTIKKAWNKEEKKTKEKKKKKKKKKRLPGDKDKPEVEGENGDAVESASDEDESNWQGGPTAEEKAVEKHLKTAEKDVD